MFRRARSAAGSNAPVAGCVQPECGGRGVGSGFSVPGRGTFVGAARGPVTMMINGAGDHPAPRDHGHDQSSHGKPQGRDASGVGGVGCSTTGWRRPRTPRRSAIPTDGGWTSVTWAQTAETVKTMAAGLLALGIQPEDRVAIASATRIEWLYADLAIMCAGGATTAVYPSTSADGRGLHPVRQRIADRLRRGRRPGRQAARPARPPARPDPGRHLRRAGGRRVGDQPGGPAGPGRQAPRREPDRRWTRPWPPSSPSTWPR